VIHLSQLEIYINALSELEYLQSLSLIDGGIRAGEEFTVDYSFSDKVERVPCHCGAATCRGLINKKL